MENEEQKVRNSRNVITKINFILKLNVEKEWT